MSITVTSKAYFNFSTMCANFVECCLQAIPIQLTFTLYM